MKLTKNNNMGAHTKKNSLIRFNLIQRHEKKKRQYPSG